MEAHRLTGLVIAAAIAGYSWIGETQVVQAEEKAAASVDAAAAKKLYLRRSCIACHGRDGRKAIQDYPALAGQRADYLIAQVEDILSGKRVGSPDASGNPRSKGMRGALIAPDGSRRITEEEVNTISNWLATLPPPELEPAQTPLAPEQAKAAADMFVEKCEACHGPAGREPLEGYPQIAGQKRVYVLAQMKDIKSKARNNGQAESMQMILEDMSDADMELLASYVSAQDPAVK
ncbi:MAG TPA: c-type cytochrome [Hyphomicrobiaceae bacterium]|nr:c-type cytochrome [Hyphomicrobiaceae bacterium]